VQPIALPIIDSTAIALTNAFIGNRFTSDPAVLEKRSLRIPTNLATRIVDGDVAQALFDGWIEKRLFSLDIAVHDRASEFASPRRHSSHAFVRASA
jgi:hypothetical protein